MTKPLHTNFPNWSREKLEIEAIAHAEALALEHDSHYIPDDVDRFVVNMLRHKHTKYDATQTAEHHRAACEAIAERFPWLRPECERQIQRRVDAEQDRAAWQREGEAQEAEARRRAQEQVAESKVVIGELAVGMPVVAAVRGHQREAVITKIGRSKVTVTFRLKNGDEREATVYARNVTEADDHRRGSLNAVLEEFYTTMDELGIPRDAPVPDDSVSVYDNMREAATRLGGMRLHLSATRAERDAAIAVMRAEDDEVNAVPAYDMEAQKAMTAELDRRYDALVQR
jgi:hypothetical protein